MKDLIERLRAEYRRLLPSARYDDKVAANLHGEAAAALEAEASEGERRGLERAAEVAKFEAEAWGHVDGSSARVAAAKIERALAPAREGE